MNKSNIEELSAGTTADSNSTAQDQQVSQPNANTNVVGSLFKSREIKFRVWDEENSIMLHDDGREQVDISFYGGKPAVVHHFTEHTIEREGVEMDIPVSDKVTNSILMQYTGLKDKNGKEIYEGDIRLVKLPFWSYYFIAPFHPTGHDGYSTIDGICEVVFNDGEFKYKVDKVLPETSAWFDEYKLDKYFSEKLITISCESILIGNVFENPELLQTLR